MTDAPISAGYVALIPLAPLVGAAVLGLGGAALQRRLGKGPIGLIACGTIALSFVLSLVAFVQLLGLEPEHRVPGLLADLFPWIHVMTGSTTVRASTGRPASLIVARTARAKERPTTPHPSQAIPRFPSRSPTRRLSHTPASGSAGIRARSGSFMSIA